MSDLESVMNRLRGVSGGGLAEFYAKEELAVLEAAEQRIAELEAAQPEWNEWIAEHLRVVVERDRLAAVIEQAKAIGGLPDGDMSDGGAVMAMLEILESADMDAVLRERDAEKWDEGADTGYDNASLPTPNWATNPYSDE